MKDVASRAKRNVTLAIADRALRRARIRAAREGTSVNEVIRRLIEEYGSQEDRKEDAIRELLRIAAKYKGHMKGRFDRNQIYEDALRRGK